MLLSLFPLCLPGLLLSISSSSNAWTIPREVSVAGSLQPYLDLHADLDEPFESKYHNDTWLARRAACGPVCPAGDTIDPDTPTCIPLCSSSGDGCFATGSQKRDVAIEVRESEFDNTNLEVSTEKHSLYKRAITPLLQGGLATYLVNQFSGTPDAHFGARRATLFLQGDTDDTTVTAQYPLAGETPFQMGAGPLVGCTVVTIASTRGVFMGHFWEVGAWSCGDATFAKRVLNWFSGATPRDGQGDVLNPALFTSAPADNTRVYIMHPRRGANVVTSSRYRVKIQTLKQTIRDALGNQNVPMYTYNYVTIDPRGPDRGLLGTTEKGTSLYQFDPDARNNGQPGWRIFYEQHEFQETDPLPDADSANGIPDL